jgi:glycosyltransferase involved in cell wall biosynthesis
MGLGAHRTLRRLLAHDRPDVVHAHLSRAGYIALAACVPFRVPLVLSVHTETREPLYRWAAHGSNRLIAVSGFIRRVLVSQGTDAGKVDVVPHGVDTELRPPRPVPDVPYGRRVLGLVGRLAPEKGQLVAIQAMPRIVATEPRAHLVCVGRDVEGFRSLLAAEAQRLGVGENVSFIAHLDDVPGFFAGCEVALLPSVIESFGLVVAEAMGQGRPVVVTPAGSLPELVEDGVSGLVVPAEPSAWADAVIGLLRDEALRTRMGAAAREHAVDEFSLDAMLDRVEMTYHRCMKGGR